MALLVILSPFIILFCIHFIGICVSINNYKEKCKNPPQQTYNSSYKRNYKKPTQKNSGYKPTYKRQAEVRPEVVYRPPQENPPQEVEEEEKIVASPTYDGVTIKELQTKLTPDDADVVSGEGFEDVIEAALERDVLSEMLNKAS